MVFLPSLPASWWRELLIIQPHQEWYSRKVHKQTNGWKDTRLRDDLKTCTYRYANRDQRKMGMKRGGTDRETKKERQSERRQEHVTRQRDIKQVSWLRPHARTHTHSHRNSSVGCKAEQPCWQACLLSDAQIIQLWPDVDYICTNKVPKWYSMKHKLRIWFYLFLHPSNFKIHTCWMCKHFIDYTVKQKLLQLTVSCGRARIWWWWCAGPAGPPGFG